MVPLIVLGLVVLVAFVTIFLVHHRKVKEEKRIQTERKIQDIQTQAKRIEPLLTKIRPHLLPYDLRAALADRWMALLQVQQDLGDTSDNFLFLLKNAEQVVSEVKSNPNPNPQPIEDQKKGQETMNLLKNVQFLIMKEFREGRIAEAKGKEFLTNIRYAATQVIIEMNKSLAAAQLQNNKYRAALIYYQNILTELKKYRGTDQEHFSSVFSEVRDTMEHLKIKAKHELAATPNLLAEGMEALEKEEADVSGFQSDMQRAIMASKARARSQGN
ncbi:MAG: hypothetical protein GX029_02720 [Pseudomonadaceae bacterium]|nr:hypothetical protein [Pseudomonadaceae bacterium]